MSAVSPIWRGSVGLARKRGRRIALDVRDQERDFEASRKRIISAAERAEKAAVTLMIRSDDLARLVARRDR